jgi:non-canonical poly(A) RNA polymerase PAPD5/7
MSQQPPLPPGLPPKLNATAPWGGDSYRPQNNEKYHSHNAPPMYQFRGAYESKPSYDAHIAPPRFNRGGHAPGTLSPRGSSGDSYRPPEGGFTFRYDAPPSLSFRQADTYRPRSPPHQRNYEQENNNNFRQNNHVDNQRNMRSGFGYRGRAGPRMASDRLFLKGNRAPTPELMPGMDEDEAHGVRYKPIEDVSDSDEAEMDLSDDENHDTEPPKKKQARTEASTADGNSVPRWSNPDPYTALPPPDESQRKKKDVVKLIRKARVTMSSENASKTEAATDDFISFDFGGQSDDQEDDDYKPPDHQGNGVPGAPTGPRSNHRDNAQKQEVQFVPQTQVQDAKARQTTAPPNAKMLPQVIDLTSDPALGNRKRNIDDEIKGPPLIHSNSKGKKPAASGRVLREWEAKVGTNNTPWVDIDHSDTANMGIW